MIGIADTAPYWLITCATLHYKVSNNATGEVIFKDVLIPPTPLPLSYIKMAAACYHLHFLETKQDKGSQEGGDFNHQQWPNKEFHCK